MTGVDHQQTDETLFFLFECPEGVKKRKPFIKRLSVYCNDLAGVRSKLLRGIYNQIFQTTFPTSFLWVVVVVVWVRLLSV